jgi:hypothetical protein
MITAAGQKTTGQECPAAVLYLTTKRFFDPVLGLN